MIVARSIADKKLPPVYAYAVETSLQLTLTELNENLREIYIEAYSQPDTAEFIYLHTTAELKQIFREANFPDYSEGDFYEMEIGTAGLMRNYMARKCDIHFPLERKLSLLFDGINESISCTGGRTGKGACFYRLD